ncbi:thioesterase domain-containing protein [Pseudoalteromonas luteoviolacea]|uniref:thioesterase II family protein n=1 Tax=Pseudoalteromonas luteoviolacea TaxID=43657 RepID=UPI001EEED974|nr:thioesterase domain-containing protein [Pseudoalteromonas luteoviolacea]MCF6439126.1 thioesterase domain-containing protein [Pseudoalteromonas luteoviolacea]
MSHEASLWVGGTENPQAKMRLFCFPAAGGGTLAFRGWAQQLPSDIEVRPIRLPGREMRIGEACFDDAYQAADALADGLSDYLDKPFAFFGHSMGSLLAFELTRSLRRRGGPMPQILMVSGRRAPSLPLSRSLYHTLPDTQFVDVLRTHYAGGTSETVLQEAQLMALFMPVIRADFAITDVYSYASEAPLDCPIHAFGGEDEPEFGVAELDAWRNETSGYFNRTLFAGDHFYLNEASRAALLSYIAEVLQAQLRAQ